MSCIRIKKKRALRSFHFEFAQLKYNIRGVLSQKQNVRALLSSNNKINERYLRFLFRAKFFKHLRIVVFAKRLLINFVVSSTYDSFRKMRLNIHIENFPNKKNFNDLYFHRSFLGTQKNESFSHFYSIDKKFIWSVLYV